MVSVNCRKIYHLSKEKWSISIDSGNFIAIYSSYNLILRLHNRCKLCNKWFHKNYNCIIIWKTIILKMKTEWFTFIPIWNDSPAANSNVKDTFYVPVVEAAALPVKGKQNTWWQFTKVIPVYHFNKNIPFVNKYHVVLVPVIRWNHYLFENANI